MRLLPDVSGAGWGLFLSVASGILTFVCPALVALGAALASGVIWPDAVFVGVGILGVAAWARVKYLEAVTTTVTGRGKTFKSSNETQ